MRRPSHNAFALPFPLAVSCDSPLDAEKIVFARDCVTSPISVAYRVRHPTFRSLKPAPWRVQRFLLHSPRGRENLPVGFEFKLMGVQPVLHDNAELSQLPFVRAEYRDVVHVAGIVPAQTALTNQPVKRLQGRIGEPLRCVRPNEDAIFDYTPNQVEYPPVFEKLPHPSHDDLRLQTLVEVVDVAAKLVLRAFQVVHHPVLDCLPLMVRSSVADAAAAVEIHAAHHLRLKNLDERVVDVLVGPLRGFADRSPLLRTGVPAARDVRCFRFKALDDDFPQLDNSLGFCFLHPCSAFVRAVMRSPVMSAVHLVDCFRKIFV